MVGERRLRGEPPPVAQVSHTRFEWSGMTARGENRGGQPRPPRRPAFEGGGARTIFAALLGALSLSVGVSALGDASPDAPVALLRAGKQAGCRIPSEKLPGLVTAGIVESEGGSAYAAWCAREGTSVYDVLVTTTSPQHPWARCPSHVRLGLNAPFPHLRVTVLPRDLPYRMALSEFRYLQGNDYLIDQGPPVLAAGLPKGPALDIGTGDAGQILLCFAGRWIMGGYH